jgi:hypothetical protein
MIANALLATTVISLAALFWLMQTCRFLIPYRAALVHVYGPALGLWAAVAFVNIFAACYAVSRVVFLKDSGQKLAHLEKQLRSGASLSDELARRLEE